MIIIVIVKMCALHYTTTIPYKPGCRQGEGVDFFLSARGPLVAIVMMLASEAGAEMHKEAIKYRKLSQQSYLSSLSLIILI
jgi:hypothetical protein